MINIISSHEELVLKIQNSSPNDKFFIHYNIVHNLGILMLKETFLFYNIKMENIAIDCKDSISYCIFSIEHSFRNILLSISCGNTFSTIKELGKNNNINIYDNKEKIFEYFGN